MNHDAPDALDDFDDTAPDEVSPDHNQESIKADHQAVIAKLKNRASDWANKRQDLDKKIAGSNKKLYAILADTYIHFCNALENRKVLFGDLDDDEIASSIVRDVFEIDAAGLRKRVNRYANVIRYLKIEQITPDHTSVVSAIENGPPRLAGQRGAPRGIAALARAYTDHLRGDENAVYNKAFEDARKARSDRLPHFRLAELVPETPAEAVDQPCLVLYVPDDNGQHRFADTLLWSDYQPVIRKAIKRLAEKVEDPTVETGADETRETDHGVDDADNESDDADHADQAILE